VALVRSFAGPRKFKRLCVLCGHRASELQTAGVCVCGHRASELQTAGVLAHMTREASAVLGDLVHRARGFSSHVYVTGDEGSINT